MSITCNSILILVIPFLFHFYHFSLNTSVVNVTEVLCVFLHSFSDGIRHHWRETALVFLKVFMIFYLKCEFTLWTYDSVTNLRTCSSRLAHQSERVLAAGEMAQQVRVCVVLVGGLGSVPSTQGTLQTYVTPVPGALMFFWLLQALHTHSKHTDRQAHTYKNILNN